MGIGQVDLSFNGYQVEVRSDSKLLRSDIVYNPRYEYHSDLANEDGGPYRNLTFEVSRRSATRGSSKPASLEVFNKKPDAPKSTVETLASRMLVHR